MPTAYAALLEETEPQIIQTDEQYDTMLRRVAELTRLGRRRTAEETKLFLLLGLLIQEYDNRHGQLQDDSTPSERLQYSLEMSGKTAADLLPIFRTRSHVNEALNGKRPISLPQALKLGDMFKMQPEYFLDLSR